MRIVSIEPTPSPNTMKLNMDEHLPDGVRMNYSKEQQEGAPSYIKQLLDIEGVKSIFQITDFIAVERFAKADWRDVLPLVCQVFADSAATEHLDSQQFNVETKRDRDTYGEYDVAIQMFKGIPIQVKITTKQEERRLGLPERFAEAAMKAQPTATNYVLEREWVEQGVRYGEIEAIGDQIVQELIAAYDEERLKHLVAQAFAQQEGKTIVAKELSEQELSAALHDSDWEKRYAALSQINPSIEQLGLIQSVLHDPKLSVRRLAVAYLGMVEDERVLPFLYEALQDKSPVIRRTAGDALSDLGNPLAISAMCTALKDKNKLVRWRAARFLYEVGDETALNALKVAEDDPEFEVSLQAKLAIERIEKGEEAEGTVWQQMTRSRE